MASHPLWTTLKNLTGNARGCVYTEPLWGIPYNLFIPYFSIYMLALGVTDQQIGTLVSIGMAFQVVWSLLSGAVTDKLGRKRTTLLFDLLCWSVPMLIWAVAQNFTYFVIAIIFNSMWRFSMTAWTCLLVEDTEPAQLVDIYSWIYISGLLAAFFAPLAGLLIEHFTLVPTMRGLLLLALVFMTAKFFIMNGMVRETGRGQERLDETRTQPLFGVIKEYRQVLGTVFRSPRTLYTLGIMLVMSVTSMINSNFWAIIATQKIGISDNRLALYTFARSLLMLVFYFLIIPRISTMSFKRPMLAGFAGYFISHLILVLVPFQGYVLLLVSALIEAVSLASLNPFVDRMVAVSVEPRERARIMGLLYMMLILLSSPFGWIAGKLSSINKALPFFLTMGLFVTGMLLVLLASRHPETPVEDVPLSFEMNAQASD